MGDDTQQLTEHSILIQISLIKIRPFSNIFFSFLIIISSWLLFLTVLIGRCLHFIVLFFSIENINHICVCHSIECWAFCKVGCCVFAHRRSRFSVFNNSTEFSWIGNKQKENDLKNLEKCRYDVTNLCTHFSWNCSKWPSIEVRPVNLSSLKLWLFGMKEAFS